MPALDNPKHERFAQELAKGQSAAESYRIAVGRDNRRYASALGHKQDILGRVAELHAERSHIDSAATAKAIEALAMDKAWVLGMLRLNAETALGLKLVKGKILTKEGGKTIVRELEFMDRDATAANQALTLIGKDMGMFIDRSENVTFNADISDKPVDRDGDDWLARHSTPH